MNAFQTAINDRLQPMRTWYAGLNAREKKIVKWGGLGAAVVIFVGLIILPLYGATSKAAQRVDQKQQDLAWMRSVAGELRAAGPAPAGSSGAPGSLIEVADQSAQQTGLGTSLTGSQPSGNGGLRVRIENAPFDTLLAWFAMLQQQHQVTVESATVDRTAEAGVVNASVVLKKTG